MQVFLRGVDESLLIGDDVTVTVLEVQRDAVRLGITDLSNVPSYWEETLYLEEVDEGSSLELASAVPW
ncbi:carbon storage regulator [bacterium]|nr:carbon storage regulator [bacterium]